MLILLPPSESKRPATSGEPVSVFELSFPELSDARSAVFSELGRVSAASDALAQLKVGASLAEEVERNTRLADEPAAPALQVYTGVLYDALGYGSMTPTQRRRADENVLITSALWGWLSPTDRIPAYRLSMGVTLGSLGPLARYWKPLLTQALESRDPSELIVDCRSSTYAAAAATDPARTVVVDVVRERDGKRTVVSHMAKHTRGEVARHLLTRRGKAPQSAGKLLDVVREVWPDAELEPATTRKPARLVVVLTD